MIREEETDPGWQGWKVFRGGRRIPGGETTIAIQARVVNEMIRLRDQFPGEHMVLVSHGDPIRAALCHWLGMPLDFMSRLEVAPGSVSVVLLDDGHVVVQSLNGL